jgi:hypothetical protein
LLFVLRTRRFRRPKPAVERGCPCQSQSQDAKDLSRLLALPRTPRPVAYSVRGDLTTNAQGQFRLQPDTAGAYIC